MSDAPELRASDAEREATATRLREAAGDGRLDHDELEERVAAAYAAKTVAELEPLTRDLPPATAPAAPTPREQALATRRERLPQKAFGFLVPNLVCNAVWLATGLGYWWPGWVLLGTGVAFLAFLFGADHDDDEHRRRHEERDERRAHRRGGPPSLPPPPRLP